MLPVAILAGGLATRLHPLTEEIPKALIEICGRPFIDWQLELLARNGIQKVVICVSHKSEMIQDFLDDGSRHGIDIAFSHDGKFQLGTGGAIRKALPHLGNEFMVLYGDSYLPIEFKCVEEDFFKIGKPAIMTVFQNNGAYDSSNVMLEGNRVSQYFKSDGDSKMTHIDFGLSIFNRTVFERYQLGEVLDLGDVCTGLADSGSLAGHEVFERFYEIGSTKGIEEFTKYIERERDVV